MEVNPNSSIGLRVESLDVVSRVSIWVQHSVPLFTKLSIIKVAIYFG